MIPDWLWNLLVKMWYGLVGYPSGYGKLYKVNVSYRPGWPLQKVKKFCQRLQSESKSFLTYRPEGWQGMYEYITDNIGNDCAIILEGELLFKLLEKKDKWPLDITDYEDVTYHVEVKIPELEGEIREHEEALKKKDLEMHERLQMTHNLDHYKFSLHRLKNSIGRFENHW